VDVDLHWPSAWPRHLGFIMDVYGLFYRW